MTKTINNKLNLFVISLFIQFICCIIITQNSYGQNNNIVATVNDTPITEMQLESREKLTTKLYNLDSSQIDSTFRENILDMLINEILLIKHAKEIGMEASKEDIDEMISLIEKKQEVPRGTIIELIKKENLDLNNFYMQMEAEFIKNNLFTTLANNTDIAPSEIDSVIFAHDKNFDFEAIFFSINNNEKNAKEKLRNFRQKINQTICNSDTREKITKENKNINHVYLNGNINSIEDKNINNMITNLRKSEKSEIYNNKENFEFIILCNKNTSLNDEDTNYTKSVIKQNKIVTKLTKLLRDLRSKAYIKINL